MASCAAMTEQRGLFDDLDPEITPRAAVVPAKATKVKPTRIIEVVNMSRLATPPRLDSLAAAETHFSVTLRKHQAETLDCLVAGRSVILNAPTSSGKSLCFQAASLLLAGSGVTVVVYPLRALVRDQVRRCRELQIPFAAYYGETPRKERPAIISAIENREVSLVLTTPESLSRSQALQRAIAKARLALLAVDEAHAFEEWSFAFRPSYRQIGPVATRLGVQRVLLCSATFTHFGAIEASRVFGRTDWEVVKAPSTRPNLHYGNLDTSPGLFIEESLRSGNSNGIMYFTAVKALESVHGYLPAGEVLRYHGQMKKKERREAQDEWLVGSKWALATKALGMGVDKSDVRTVVHAQLPASVLDYAQEAGRAGRDGKPASCLLTQSDDGSTARFLLEMSLPSPNTVERVFNLLVRRSSRVADEDGWFDLDPPGCAETLGVSEQAVYVSARWLADSNILKLSVPDRDWTFVFPPDIDSRAEAAGRMAPEIVDLLREYGQESGSCLHLSADEVEEAIEGLFTDWKGKLERMADAGIFEMEAPVREKRKVAVVSTDYSKFDGRRLEDARQRAFGRLSRMLLLQAAPPEHRASMIEQEATTDVAAFKLELARLAQEKS